MKARIEIEMDDAGGISVKASADTFAAQTVLLGMLSHAETLIKHPPEKVIEAADAGLLGRLNGSG